MFFARSRIILSFLIMAAGVVCAADQGTMAPEFTLPDIAGKNFSLGDQRGKVVFIDFWASWCPPCRASIPEVEILYEKYRGRDVRFVGINIENDVNAARSFVKKKGMKYPVLIGDQQIARDYRVNGIPSFFIIDQNGRIVQNYVGFHGGMTKEWIATIERLLSSPGKTVPEPSRKTTR